jgi:NAD(P)H-nitrite reductase large subunit
MKLDAKRREYDIIVIGEESHLAYNRVGLTSFFQHRKVENLYLNPQEWVSFHTSIEPRNWTNFYSTPPARPAL